RSSASRRPFPIYTIDDPMLRMYSVKGCVNSDSAWAPISKDTLPDLKELVEKSKPLLDYMKEKDGRDPTISNAADIADNIINMVISLLLVIELKEESSKLQIGKRQAFGLGKEVRSFIGKFIDTDYKADQAKFYSSSANRCKMTLQSALAGLFDTSKWPGWTKEKLGLETPIPYTIDDPMLRMYSVKGCVNSDSAWAPISKDTLPDLKELVEKSKPLLDYMKEVRD
ncbi:hypothetical protein PRIPAC_75649, partial [Pristionchus pacificus]|uniref:Phosphatase n=1 Tax=Pristionchus pacificus TaxID=54126 RepID=A0A2A6CS07_PRIPA